MEIYNKYIYYLSHFFSFDGDLQQFSIGSCHVGGSLTGLNIDRIDYFQRMTMEMTLPEFRTCRDFFAKKALALMKHENKAYAKVGFPAANFRKVVIEDRRFLIAQTNAFQAIMNDVLGRANERFSERFGTRNAHDVLDALFDAEPIFSRESFTSFIQNEQFAWVVELGENNTANPNILRLDLFRAIKEERDHPGQFEFIGGLFHAFKHFCYKGVPLSTNKENHDLVHPTAIYNMAIRAFYFEPLQPNGLNKYYSFIAYDEKYRLRFDFYFETITSVYFIDSVRKESVKR